MKSMLYMQNDPKWASHDYSAPGEKTTIKAEGCGITCAAMVIATLADKNVTPVTTAEWSKKRGYKAKGQVHIIPISSPRERRMVLILLC